MAQNLSNQNPNIEKTPEEKKRRRKLIIWWLSGGLFVAGFFWILFSVLPTEEPLQELTLNATQVELTEGDTLTLDLSTNIPLDDLIFESYDSEVATLQGSIVQGLSAGEVLVVVRSKTGEVSDSLIVRVNARPVVEDASFDLTIDGTRVTYTNPLRLSELAEPSQEG